MPPLIGPNELTQKESAERAKNAYETNFANNFIKKNRVDLEKIVKELIDNFRERYQRAEVKDTAKVVGNVYRKKYDHKGDDFIYKTEWYKPKDGDPSTYDYSHKYGAIFRRAVCDYIASRIAELTEDDPSRIFVSVSYDYDSGSVSGESTQGTTIEENSYELRYAN